MFRGLLLGGILAVTAGGAPRDAMLLSEPTSLAILTRGRAEVLAGYFERGERTFYELSRRPDGAAAAYHHLATTSLLKVLMFDRDRDHQAFFQRSDSLREILQRVPDSPGKLFLGAETDFQRSVAWAKREHYVRAAMASVSAYRVLTGLVERDASFVEAYKTLGIVHATLGTLPRRYRRFLSVFGFETEMAVGLDQLERAARESTYGREESILFMAILDSFEMPSRVEASAALEALRLQYDGSPLFGLVRVDALLRSRRVAEADSLLRSLPTEEGLVQLDYLQFYRAEVHLKQEDWGAAASAYARYLTAHDGTALKAVAALNMGLARELSGNRLGAEEAYGRVAAAREYDSDEASARQARALLERPMTGQEHDLFRARMAHDRGAYTRADSLLRLLDTRAGLPESMRGEIAYRRGRTLDESGQDAQALIQYQAAADRPGDPRAKWAPYSLFYMARIHEEAGRLEEARRLYQAVVDYKPAYDYRGTNEQRARFALVRLGG